MVLSDQLPLRGGGAYDTEHPRDSTAREAYPGYNRALCQENATHLAARPTPRGASRSPRPAHTESQQQQQEALALAARFDAMSTAQSEYTAKEREEAAPLQRFQ